MINKFIGNNIRKLRENAGFTQNNLATFLNVDQSLISKIEKSDRTLPAEMLEKLSALFGVTIEQIESEFVEAPKISFAFRGSELDAEGMEAISAINKIVLNSEFMRALCEEARL